MATSQHSSRTEQHPAPKPAEQTTPHQTSSSADRPASDHNADAPAPNPHAAPVHPPTGVFGVHPDVAHAMQELVTKYGMPHVEQALKEIRGTGAST